MSLVQQGQSDGASVLGQPAASVQGQTACLPQVHSSCPIFTSTRGPEGHSLGVQASALLLRLANVQLSAIHILLGINHKALERMSRNLDLVRKNYVEQKQQTMSVDGKAKTWTQVEADEAVFDKYLVPAEEAPTPTQAMKWEQWLGLVARGRPSSLVLLRFSPVMTKKRAPGPGAPHRRGVAEEQEGHTSHRQRPKLQNKGAWAAA